MSTARLPEDRQQRQNAIMEENRKIRQLRRLIDITCVLLAHSSISLLEACGLIRHAKEQALELFPDKESTFELLYRRRLARVLEERISNSQEFMN